MVGAKWGLITLEAQPNNRKTHGMNSMPLWAMQDLSGNVYIAIQPAVPDYEEWGAEGHKVRVDGRVWIKVK